MTSENILTVQIFAGVLSAAAVLSMTTGITVFRGVIRREEEPGRFWTSVISLSLLAVFLWILTIESLKSLFGSILSSGVALLIPLTLFVWAVASFFKGEIEFRGGAVASKEEDPIIFTILIVAMVAIAVLWLVGVLIISRH